MTLIYQPRGKAREYSPLALNIFTGCDHGCEYCYVKKMRFLKNPTEALPKVDVVKNLRRELEKRGAPDKQVLLSFIGDPYCQAENGLTREVLKVLADFDVPTAVLTKGGTRCLRDIGLFKRFSRIKIGATLTFRHIRDWQIWEPGAAKPQGRTDALKALKDAGLMTWVSFEPVVNTRDTLELIQDAGPFVDQMKIGRWNHDKRADNIDWCAFGLRAVTLARDSGAALYVKKDLQAALPPDFLRPEEVDMDALALRR